MPSRPAAFLVLSEDPDAFRALSPSAPGATVEVEDDPVRGRDAAARREWTAVFVDADLDGGAGPSVAEGLAATGHVVVLATRTPSLELAARAAKAGVRDVVTLPLDPSRVDRHLPGPEPEEGSIPLARSADEGNLLGKSREILDLFRAVARLDRSRANVLVVGEPGTGKRTLARFVHRKGPDPSRPFVELGCAALTEPLLESELFGHREGAWPWAISNRRGRLERAGGGVLFLDAVDELPLRLQMRLLHALREGFAEPVGGGPGTEVSARVIAAANRDPDDLVAEGAFLPDLLEQLAEVRLDIPPIRERPQDLVLLATHFGAVAARERGSGVTALSEEAARKLETHDWPGNVRELRKVMEEAVLRAAGPTIRAEDLPDRVRWPGGAGRDLVGADDVQARATLEEVEAAHIRRVLRTTGENLSQCADILGIHRNTLRRKLRKYGITS